MGGRVPASCSCNDCRLGRFDFVIIGKLIVGWLGASYWGTCPRFISLNNGKQYLQIYSIQHSRAVGD